MAQTQEQQYHFFASCWHSWRCNEKLPDLIKYMEDLDSEMDYLVFYVPAPLKANYQIEHYVPKVDGVLSLGKYTTPKKRKK